VEENIIVFSKFNKIKQANEKGITYHHRPACRLKMEIHSLIKKSFPKNVY